MNCQYVRNAAGEKILKKILPSTALALIMGLALVLSGSAAMATSNPIPGVDIIVKKHPHGIPITTHGDASGKFSVKVTEPGQYTLSTTCNQKSTCLPYTVVLDGAQLQGAKLDAHGVATYNFIVGDSGPIVLSGQIHLTSDSTIGVEPGSVANTDHSNTQQSKAADASSAILDAEKAVKKLEAHLRLTAQSAGATAPSRIGGMPIDPSDPSGNTSIVGDNKKGGNQQAGTFTVTNTGTLTTGTPSAAKIAENESPRPQDRVAVGDVNGDGIPDKEGQRQVGLDDKGHMIYSDKNGKLFYTEAATGRIIFVGATVKLIAAGRSPTSGGDNGGSVIRVESITELVGDTISRAKSKLQLANNAFASKEYGKASALAKAAQAEAQSTVFVGGASGGVWKTATLPQVSKPTHTNSTVTKPKNKEAGAPVINWGDGTPASKAEVSYPHNSGLSPKKAPAPINENTEGADRRDADVEIPQVEINIQTIGGAGGGGGP